MKFGSTVIASVIAGMVVWYFSVYSREESLIYYVSEPAQFADTTFQIIQIQNEGSEPATNIKVYVDLSPSVERPQYVSKFEISSNGADLIGGYERLRKDESASISLVTKGAPLSADKVRVKSDRSVAAFSKSIGWALDTKSYWYGFGTFFAIFVVLGIYFPAKRDYLEAARLAREYAETEKNKDGA